MHCSDIERLRTAYVDGELADGRASALRGHLRGCVACRELVEDEARLAGAAEELESLDPPPALWDAIRERIADEEIADGERGRLWLWWQGLREHALPATVAAAALVLVVVWLARPSHELSPEPPGPPEREQPVLAAGQDSSRTSVTPVAPAAAIGFDSARRAELLRTDARYTQVLIDLRELAEFEREHMTEQESEQLTATLVELSEQARQQRTVLASTGSLDPGDREELYTTYREEISVLRGIAMAGVMR